MVEEESDVDLMRVKRRVGTSLVFNYLESVRNLEGFATKIVTSLPPIESQVLELLPNMTTFGIVDNSGTMGRFLVRPCREMLTAEASEEVKKDDRHFGCEKSH